MPVWNSEMETLHFGAVSERYGVSTSRIYVLYMFMGSHKTPPTKEPPD